MISLTTEFEDDERAPVTAFLTHEQAVRLEVLIARVRGLRPAVDDNAIVDSVFAVGLTVAEEVVSLFPEQAG